MHGVEREVDNVARPEGKQRMTIVFGVRMYTSGLPAGPHVPNGFAAAATAGRCTGTGLVVGKVDRVMLLIELIHSVRAGKLRGRTICTCALQLQEPVATFIDSASPRDTVSAAGGRETQAVAATIVGMCRCREGSECMLLLLLLLQ